jgi:hypothetical protein
MSDSLFSFSLEIRYSDVEGAEESVFKGEECFLYWGGGMIDTDPWFVDYRGYDYILHPKSLCIDAGDPGIEDGLYDWHPRWPKWYPDGVRSDMGVYGGPGNIDWVR